jgi:hypothetical protein
MAADLHLAAEESLPHTVVVELVTATHTRVLAIIARAGRNIAIELGQ